ncbi:MAG: histidine kinase N-terminal 7TM domain-containing protein [Methanolobus sp.]
MYLNYYAIPLVILVFILSFLLFHIRRYKDAAGSTCFSLLLAATIIYSSFYALEISSNTYETALTFYKLEYIGVPFIPAFFLTFSMRYTGKKKWLNAPTLVSIFAVPLITMVLVLTIGGHTLYHKEIFFSTETIFPALVYEPGPWYIIQEFYNVLCIMLGQVHCCLIHGLRSCLLSGNR